MARYKAQLLGGRRGRRGVRGRRQAARRAGRAPRAPRGPARHRLRPRDGVGVDGGDGADDLRAQGGRQLPRAGELPRAERDLLRPPLPPGRQARRPHRRQDGRDARIVRRAIPAQPAQIRRGSLTGNLAAQSRRALLSPAQPSHAGTGPTPTRSTPSPSRSANGRRRRPGCSRAGPTPPPSHSSTTTKSSTRRSRTSSRSKRGGSERAAGQPPCAYVCHVS